MTGRELSRKLVFIPIQWRRMLRGLAVLAAMLCAGAEGQAQDAAPELPTQPILHIETGKHGALIRQIDTDAANRFAVTASDDKTVRVWSLPNARPLRVLRLPIDQGDIGKAYAVAISPDGTTVAVGGWTASAGPENIFLFDRASGELTQRLTELPSSVAHLAYSPDGRHLAASLGGSIGIRVFDASNGCKPLPSDTEYGDLSYSAAFDRSGRLITTSLDGSVRRYAADHYDKPIAHFETRRHRSYSAAFSPDGARAAVGHDDTNDVVVLSGTDLKLLFKANTADVPNVGLNAVGWSEDSQYLFAGGHCQVNNVWQVRRWSDGGRGAFVDIPTAMQDIRQILRLKDGPMLAMTSSSFGVIQTDAKPTQLQGFGALVLVGGRRPLQISEGGDTVQFDSWSPFTLIDLS